MADGERPGTEEHQIGEHANVPGGAERSAHEPSNVDAMGKDKRRAVVGKTYGPTVRKQLTVWGSVVAVLLVAVILFIVVVNRVDNRDIERAEAPWATETLEEPNPVDFPANGPQPKALNDATDIESGSVPRVQRR